MNERAERHLADVHGVSRGAASSAWRTHRRGPEALTEPEVALRADFELAHEAPASLSWQELQRGAKIRSRLRLLTSAVLAWAWNYFKYVFRRRYPFPTYATLAKQHPKSLTTGSPSRNGIIELQGSTVALAGDWGTGTKSAYAVAQRIRKLSPDYTIHLGDVYYSGTGKEFDCYFLPDDAWPHGTKGTFALNGNHEMYSGGRAYFNALKREPLTYTVGGERVPQEVSYFCLQNADWRILGIDTGYYAKSFPVLELFDTQLIKLHRAIRAWLKDVVFADPNDRRPVILLSHHEWFSAFDSEYKRMGKQMQPYLGSVLLWFWGHEHRFAGYGPFGFDGGPKVRARCIGHGGIPFDIAYPHRNRELVFSDERIDCASTNQINARQQLGFCGFSVLTFEGPNLRVEYYDESGESPLLVERWSYDSQTGTATGVVEGGRQLAKYRDGAGGEKPKRVCGAEEGLERLGAVGGTWTYTAEG